MSKKIMISLIIGFGFGVMVCLAFGAYVNYKDPDRLIIDRPKKFGDLTILAQRTDSNDVALTIAKGRKIFFYAQRNAEYKVNQIAIADPNCGIRFTLDFSEKAGQWQYATYGAQDNSYYLDKNYDGKFDFIGLDYEGGEFQSNYIFIDPNFIKVHYVNGNKAGNRDGPSFIFDSLAGWQPQTHK
jgi:hypothetical protein